jgi:hypothetical protein
VIVVNGLSVAGLAKIVSNSCVFAALLNIINALSFSEIVLDFFDLAVEAGIVHSPFSKSKAEKRTMRSSI